MWKILGRYNGGEWEVVDEFDTEKEAREMLTEYRMAFGNGWSLMIKKGR